TATVPASIATVAARAKIRGGKIRGGKCPATSVSRRGKPPPPSVTICARNAAATCGTSPHPSLPTCGGGRGLREAAAAADTGGACKDASVQLIILVSRLCCREAATPLMCAEDEKKCYDKNLRPFQTIPLD